MALVGAGSSYLATSWSPIAVPQARAEDEIPAHVLEIAVLEGMFRSMKISEWDKEEDRLVFFYGHRLNDLRQIELKKGTFRRLWKSQPLGATIREIFVEDLDRDGVDEVIDYTAAGEITVWQKTEQEGYTIRWESVAERFESVQAMAVANADRDSALELILCADHHIVIYDGVEFAFEKAGRDEFNPTRLLVGNVDADADEELVTSDGSVINITTLGIEWSTEPFADPICLYDLDDDGAMELIGEQAGAINVWSLRDRREIW
jgi:hypothetical protein